MLEVHVGRVSRRRGLPVCAQPAVVSLDAEDAGTHAKRSVGGVKTAGARLEHVT